MPVPAARILAVADAFLAELNTVLAEWEVVTPQEPPLDPLPVVAERKYSTQYAIDEITVLHVDVQVATLAQEVLNRAPTLSNEYGVNVIVQKQVDPTDDAAIDDLAQLTIAIYEHWPDLSIVAGDEEVSVMRREILIYSPTLLDEETRYFGVVTFIMQEKTG